MRKISIIVLISGLMAVIIYYHHNYIETMMLSDIVSHTNNPSLNIVVSLVDFDTGLTRHDIKVLEEKKDYWLGRIQEVDAISDPDQKEQASLKLLSDMMEDPVLKKIGSGILNLGFDVSIGIIQMIL